MKKLLILTLLFVGVGKINGQTYAIRSNNNGWLPYTPHDTMCNKRGHVWKNISPRLSLYNMKGDTLKFPLIQESYIKDEKDISYRVTPLIWNYSCERCGADSTSYKKEIVWRKH